MTQDLISYLQESRFNVKIYAEYFVMFNKWELEEASPSVFSAVSEPLRVLVPAPPGSVLPRRHRVPLPLCSSPPEATAPLSDSMCLTGFPRFDNVCGKK